MDRAAASDPSRGEGLSPFIAGGIALLLIVGLVGAWMLARPDSPPTVRGEPAGAIEEPDYSLTNAEAIARFEELDALRLEAIEARDFSIAQSALTDDSPLRQLLHKDIRRLQSSQVLVKSNFKTRWLKVISSTSHSIVVRQGVYQDPDFHTEAGTSVQSTDAQFRVIDWTLQLDGLVWKIFDSEILKSRTEK